MNVKKHKRSTSVKSHFLRNAQYTHTHTHNIDDVLGIHFLFLSTWRLTPRYVYLWYWVTENCAAQRMLFTWTCARGKIDAAAPTVNTSKGVNRNIESYRYSYMHSACYTRRCNLHARVNRVRFRWRTSSRSPRDSQLRNCSQVQGWTTALTAIDTSPDVSMSNAVIRVGRNIRYGWILRDASADFIISLENYSSLRIESGSPSSRMRMKTIEKYNLCKIVK